MHKWLSMIGLFLLPSVGLLSDMTPIVEDLPLHEAFVSRIGDITPLEPISTQPPPPAGDSIPPQPNADTVWIPGYWAWLNERNDFAWIPGTWRKPPPQHHWVAGFWRPLNGGWLWIPGFWSPLTSTAISFITLPPPDTIDENLGSAPSPDYFWVHGYWEYSPTSGKYSWLNGVWQPFNPELILIPAHYQWRPEGFVFVPPYWDWQIEMRGTAYLKTNPPVALDASTIVRRLFVYYPDYLTLFWHYWHFHPDWWKSCWCLPPWWNSTGWWGLTWHSQWSLWWWYGHQGYPQPQWVTKEISTQLPSPPQELINLFKKVESPLFVTDKGIPTSNQWLEAIQAVMKSREKAPVMPLDPKLRELVKEQSQTELPSIATTLEPSSKEEMQRLTKPTTATGQPNVRGDTTVKVPTAPIQMTTKELEPVRVPISPIILPSIPSNLEVHSVFTSTPERDVEPANSNVEIEAPLRSETPRIEEKAPESALLPQLPSPVPQPNIRSNASSAPQKPTLYMPAGWENHTTSANDQVNAATQTSHELTQNSDLSANWDRVGANPDNEETTAYDEEQPRVNELYAPPTVPPAFFYRYHCH